MVGRVGACIAPRGRLPRVPASHGPVVVPPPVGSHPAPHAPAAAHCRASSPRVPSLAPSPQGLPPAPLSLRSSRCSLPAPLPSPAKQPVTGASAWPWPLAGVQVEGGLGRALGPHLCARPAPSPLHAEVCVGPVFLHRGFWKRKAFILM